MNSSDIQIGSTITNGSSALRITERVHRDVRWGTSGWRGMCIPTEQFGGNPGMSDFIPDYLLSGWRHVPFEWTPCVGAQVEERYIWADGYRWLQREVRRAIMPTVDGIRGHMVTTPEEDELRLRLTLAIAAEPITPAEADELLASLRDRPRLPDVLS